MSVFRSLTLKFEGSDAYVVYVTNLKVLHIAGRLPEVALTRMTAA